MSKTNEKVESISMDQKLKVKEIEKIYTYLKKKTLEKCCPVVEKKTVEISLTMVFMTIGTVRIFSGISMKRINLVLFRRAQRKKHGLNQRD